MNGTIILLIIIFVTFLLGRHAIREGHRVEQQKKFIKNMNKHSKNK